MSRRTDGGMKLMLLLSLRLEQQIFQPFLGADAGDGFQEFRDLSLIRQKGHQHPKLFFGLGQLLLECLILRRVFLEVRQTPLLGLNAGSKPADLFFPGACT